MNDLMEKGLEGVPRDLSSSADAATGPSPCAVQEVARIAQLAGLLLMAERVFGEKGSVPDAPFLDRFTKAVIDKMANQPPVQQPVEAASGIDQNLISPKTGEGG